MNLREQLADAQAEVARIWRAIEREENPAPKRPALRALEDRLVAAATLGCDIRFAIGAIRVERDTDPEAALAHGKWLKSQLCDHFLYETLVETRHGTLDAERLVRHFTMQAGLRENHLAAEMRRLMKLTAEFEATDAMVLVLCDIDAGIRALSEYDDFELRNKLRMSKALRCGLDLAKATSDEGRAALAEIVTFHEERHKAMEAI